MTRTNSKKERKGTGDVPPHPCASGVPSVHVCLILMDEQRHGLSFIVLVAGRRR